MFIILVQWLSHYWHVFAVFHYITLRAVMAALTALCLSLIFGGHCALVARFEVWSIDTN